MLKRIVHFIRPGLRPEKSPEDDKKQATGPTETSKIFLRKVRWQIAILAHLGFAISFGMRANFGVAKTRMTSNFTDAHGELHNQEFFWTNTELGMLESSFFYGYAASQIPAGILAAKFAPNRLLCLGILTASFLNILIAIGFYYHPFSDLWVVVMQALQGCALGVIYPAMHGVWRLWAPPMERSKLATTTFTGGYVGVMLGLSVSAFLVSYSHWSAPFYAFGAAGIIWSILWMFLSSQSPADHSYISNEERRYIMEHVGPVASANMTLTTVPWKSILVSPAVWAISIANFCRSWTFFLLLNNQLVYMKDALHMDLRNSGFVSMLPHLVMAASVLSSGQIADYLRSSGKLETQTVRKLFNTLGFTMEALFLGILAFSQNPVVAIFCLVLAAGGSGTSLAGFNVNHFDIAPRYASILMGLSNGFGALAGFSSYLTEHLTRDDPTGWKWCFLVAVMIDLFGIAFYLLFGKGEIQQWAKEPEPEQSFARFARKISSKLRTDEPDYKRFEDSQSEKGSVSSTGSIEEENLKKTMRSEA